MEFEVPPIDISIMAQNGTGLSEAGLAMKDIMPYTVQDMIFSLRCHFYLWTPRETMFKTLAEVPNMFTRVISYMPFLVVFEIIGLLARGKELPRWNHSLMSVCTAILLFLSSTILGNIEFTWFSMIHDKYRIMDLPWNSVSAWIVCFFACDLGSYLWHRAAHEVNFVWAFHSVHHTSDEINIMAGYRLPTFNRQIAIIFEGPDWMGKVIITPRLHRVHHARNRYCIDKNYGAVLSIWDYLLGTFTPFREDIPLSFGLVSRITSFDPIAIQFTYMKSIAMRAASYDNWTDRIYCFIKGPGWEPGKPRLGVYEEIPQIYDDKPYDKQSPSWCYAYLTWTLGLAIILFGTIPQAKKVLESGEWFFIVVYLFWTVSNSGYFLEQKPWVTMSEVVRCGCFFLLERMIAPMLAFYPLLWTALRYTSILSLVLWSFKINMFCPKDDIKID
ncbi:hypothetical protein LSH36_1173g00008 [Paralvinella palmiformis]|uniref:Alkylglycerol monooxygenase n=1 Tax=Paralvinella palmiformis TaxID=53620 RepID=A0AAD9IUZ0_9ANNE|nr:hypothetical protein LSH36_1173g00008 [Paralvinella palmiformis]